MFAQFSTIFCQKYAHRDVSVDDISCITRFGEYASPTGISRRYYINGSNIKD